MEIIDKRNDTEARKKSESLPVDSDTHRKFYWDAVIKYIIHKDISIYP